MDPQTLSTDLNCFFESLFRYFKQSSLDLPVHWNIDHVCYRTESIEEYSLLKKQLHLLYESLGESLVHGRPISVFSLKTPFFYHDYAINCIELCAPKPGSPYSSGFEHCEIVIDQSLTSWHRSLLQNTSSSELQKTRFGQEFRTQLGEISVKWHSLSLPSILQIEKSTQTLKKLKDLDLISQLSDHDPLIIGTIPLGIDISGSDFDLALSTPDPKGLCEKIQRLYGDKKDFQVIPLKESSDWLCRFKEEDLEFELFVSQTGTPPQRGFRHFFLEERLLKIGGDRLRRVVKKLKSEGNKTEAAFCHCLGIQGEDPFLDLLELYKYSDRDLAQVVEVSLN